MIQTINPYNGEKLAEYTEDNSRTLQKKLEIAQQQYEKWRFTSYDQRAQLILEVAKLIRKKTDKYAMQMTLEMGKPISQSRSELEKCAWLCEYYAHNAEQQLENEYVKTDHFKSYVSYEPLGVVMAVMPWNYPFWQVMRFIVPALMAGNVGVLKHASSVMGSAQLLQELFLEAGFPKGCFTNLIIGSKAVEQVIKNPIIKAVTLTGSKPAGSSVAATAGSVIKKTVLELGGNNALVVFKDADLEKTVETCIAARYQNTGQSCIAGKRLLLHEDITAPFMELFIKAVKGLKIGDPQQEDTYIGVMSREDLAIELEELMNRSIEMGAKLMVGGNRDKAFFEPTVLTQVTSEMPVFKEETFGPLIAVTTFKTDHEAVQLVNKSEFGLGVSLFTQDLEKAQKLVPRCNDGAVFVNAKVASHPALPFGGTGISGYGRELSHFGIREFCNVKTVVIDS